MAMLLDAWRSARLDLPLLANPQECTGKTYIVTGSNIGIGLEVVRHLVAQKASHVIMAVRSLERGERARQDVETTTGITGVAEVWHLDLSSYESIKKFVERAKKLERVDGVLQNAVSAENEWVDAEGWERGITVNVFGATMLAVLLMPYLRECGRRFDTVPAISFVGSGMAFMAEKELGRLNSARPLEDWNDQAKFPAGMPRYSMAKLMLLFAFRKLAELAPPGKSGIVLNYSDPGPCRNTGLVRYADFISAIQVKVLYSFLSRSAEMGSRALIHALMVGPESHGKFVENCSLAEAAVPDWARNEEADRWAESVWNQVAAELEKVVPGCIEKALP